MTGGDELPPACGFQDGAAIGMGLIAAIEREDARIARGFLIGAIGAIGDPSDRIAPMDAKQQQRDHIGQQVAALMMGALMRHRHFLLQIVIALREIDRQDDHRPQHAKGQRPRCLRAGDRADTPLLPQQNRAIEHMATETDIAHRLEQQKRQQPDEPERNPRFQPWET